MLLLGLLGKPWLFGLVDAGYDVWLGNNRGTKYSNVKIGTGANPSSKQHWDWTSEELAKYDLPAEIDTVLAVTGKPKLKYVGYSRGSSIMFIGLALNEESYFASRVSKFIAIAPCIWTSEVKFFGNTFNYEDAVRAFSKLDEQNIYKFKSFGEAVSVNELLYFEQIRIEDRF